MKRKIIFVCCALMLAAGLAYARMTVIGVAGVVSEEAPPAGDVALAGTLQSVDAAAASGSVNITIDADADVCVVSDSRYRVTNQAYTSTPYITINSANITEVYKYETDYDTNHLMLGYILQSTINATGTVALAWNRSQPIDNGGRIYVQCFKNVNTSSPISDSDGNHTNNTDITGLTASAGDMMVGVISNDTNALDLSGSSQTVLADETYNELGHGIAYKLSATDFNVGGGSSSNQAALILNKAE